MTQTQKMFEEHSRMLKSFGMHATGGVGSKGTKGKKNINLQAGFCSEDFCDRTQHNLHALSKPHGASEERDCSAEAEPRPRGCDRGTAGERPGRSNTRCVVECVDRRKDRPMKKEGQ